MKNKGKRLFLGFMILLVAAFCCATFVACNVDDVKEVIITPNTVNIRIGEFNYSDYKVTATYGSGKIEEATLTEEMIAPKDRLKFFLEGEHEIEVEFLRNTTTFKVNVRRNVFAGAEFNDLDVVYNGEFYTVEVKNVPEGTIVSYPTTNRFRTAGEYQATAILRKDSFEMKEMVAKVNIRKADYDLSGVTFENQTVEYDGSSHMIEMEGTLPSGLYVNYTITREGGREEKGNSATNAGVYTVEARFSGDTTNYNVVDNKQAILTINQASIDVSNLTFENKIVTYDRTIQSIEVEGNIPHGVNVTYLNNEHVDAGSYEVTATFSVDDTVNFAAIPDMKATLTILKAEYDMSAVHFNGMKVTYDGQEHKIEIIGQLPNGVKVEYNGNEGINAGSYDAVAKFTSGNVNYNDPISMTATLIIDPAIAQMDQIVFERRRFISIVLEKEDADEYMDWYDPYLVANEYRPENVPVGFSMKAEYKKTDNWQADLESNIEDLTGFVDKITEDGYYLVKITFDGGSNYVDEKPTTTTVIRIDTIDDDDISTWQQLVYDNSWVNPETNNVAGVFMDYFTGACVEKNRKTFIIGDTTIQYCDCNVFLNYADIGEDALKSDEISDRYIPESKLKDYREFADSYFTFVKTFKSTGIAEFDSFLEAAVKASNTVDTEEYYGEDREPSYDFDKDKAVYVTINGVLDSEIRDETNQIEKTATYYHEALAHLFGFENKNDFYGEGQITGNVFDTYCNMTFQASVGVSNDNPIACEGAVYVKNTDSEDYAFIFPYVFRITETKALCVFIFCSVIDGVRNYAALVNDAGMLFDFFENIPDGKNTYLLEGRCLTSELNMTEEGTIYRLATKTKTVIVENGTEVLKPITDGKDLRYVEDSEYTEHLIYGNVEVYRFLSELPGSCSEISNGYDPNEFNIVTDTTIYSYCDCDAFATIIKADGDATGITVRNDREDHPQMKTEIADKFDQLSYLYQGFISNYVTGEDVINEWKIGSSNRNYETYKTFFDYASNMIYKSNRNMGKDSDYVLNRSVIIGMNRSYSIAISSSNYSYRVDEYRLMVAKLFGFTDLEQFIAAVNSLSDVLVKNGKYANVDSISSRLLYDGAILTLNDYFVLPYAIKSELSTKKVMVFIFVDKKGAVSIWINDARNAFNATNFGETVWDMSDKFNVSIYGRCLMYEDDGYIMNEDLGKNVSKMINKLQQYPQYLFKVGGVKENCYVTDENADYYAHIYYLGGRCSELNLNHLPGYDYGGVSVLTDDCNPFYTLNGDWIFDDIDNLKEHSLYSIPASLKAAFNGLSNLYSAFLGNFEIPTEGAQYIPTVSGNALESYTALYNAAVELYESSAYPAFIKGTESDLTKSAIIGLNRPFTILLNSDTTSQETNYRLAVANILGIDDEELFSNYVEQMEILYSDYRADLKNSLEVNKAMENGCFVTNNDSFVFPIAVQSTSLYNVLLYMVIDKNNCISIWVNNVDSLLYATRFDDNHLVFDEDQSIVNNVYCKNMIFLKDIPYDATVFSCDCDPLLNIQKNDGKTNKITSRYDRGDNAVITDTVAEQFDNLSVYFAYYN